MKKLYQMHKQGFQLLRFIYRLDHSALPIFLLRHTMEAVSPYLQILFSASVSPVLYYNSIGKKPVIPFSSC